MLVLWAKDRRPAHLNRFVRIHVGVGQRCRAIDGDTPALCKPESGARNVPLGNGGNVYKFKIQALTSCDAKITSTRTAAGQFKGQFKGAIDENSGEVQDASTHIRSGGVVMDIAAYKVCHSLGPDIDATALRAARARSSSIDRGDG